MIRLVPHNSAVSLVVPPTVWLGYFVVTFLLSELGCARGWAGSGGPGFGMFQVLLGAVTLAAFVLLGYASWAAWQNLRFARDPDEPTEPELRERWIFLARASLFLCGISLLGTAWGAINLFVFTSCER